MKLITACLVAVSLLIVENRSAHASPKTYVIDAQRSNVQFQFMPIRINATGQFVSVGGTVTYDAGAPEASKVNAMIEVGSLKTGEEQRDQQLKGPNFFDIVKFPLITFTSNSVKPTSETTADVVGTLALHGFTKNLPLSVTLVEKIAEQDGSERIRLKATTVIKQSDYGFQLDAVREVIKMVEESIAVNIEIEAISK
jgi:polyisoprenoid-binding protein YceI